MLWPTASAVTYRGYNYTEPVHARWQSVSNGGESKPCHSIQQERQQAQALIGLLPPAKLGAVRNLLEVLLHEDSDTLSPAEAKAIAEADEMEQAQRPYPATTRARRVRSLHGRLGEDEPRAINSHRQTDSSGPTRPRPIVAGWDSPSPALRSNASSTGWELTAEERRPSLQMVVTSAPTSTGPLVPRIDLRQRCVWDLLE